jgi:hypothetical protein
MFDTKQTALQEFFRKSTDDRAISYVASKASRIIICESLPKTSETSSPHVHGQDLFTIEDDGCNHDDSDLTSLKIFLSTLVHKCEVDNQILLTVLLYLSRLKATLTAIERGLPCTPHRIVLASLIHAANYLGYCRTRDILRNACMSENASLPLVRFSREDVVSMEEDFYTRLRGDFTISESTLYQKLRALDGRGRRKRLASSKHRRRRLQFIAKPIRTVHRVKGLLVTNRRGALCRTSRLRQHFKAPKSCSNVEIASRG